MSGCYKNTPAIAPVSTVAQKFCPPLCQNLLAGKNCRSEEIMSLADEDMFSTSTVRQSCTEKNEFFSTVSGFHIMSVPFRILLWEGEGTLNAKTKSSVCSLRDSLNIK